MATPGAWNSTTGKLAIEGANALGITGEYGPDEPGVVDDVAPGDYVVSLFNMHWEQLRDELPDYSNFSRA